MINDSLNALLMKLIGELEGREFRDFFAHNLLDTRACASINLGYSARRLTLGLLVYR